MDKLCKTFCWLEILSKNRNSWDFIIEKNWAKKPFWVRKIKITSCASGIEGNTLTLPETLIIIEDNTLFACFPDEMAGPSIIEIDMHLMP